MSSRANSLKPVLVRILLVASVRDPTQINLVATYWSNSYCETRDESLASVMKGSKGSNSITAALSLQPSVLFSSVLGWFSDRYAPWAACVQMDFMLIIPESRDVWMTIVFPRELNISQGWGGRWGEGYWSYLYLIATRCWGRKTTWLIALSGPHWKE